MTDKPVPKRGTHTGPFWDGAKAGKLMLPHCLNVEVFVEF